MGRLQTGHSSPNIVAGPTDRARPGAWILGPGYWGLDTGAWILGPGYWGMDTGAWILGPGYQHSALLSILPSPLTFHWILLHGFFLLPCESILVLILRVFLFLIHWSLNVVFVSDGRSGEGRKEGKTLLGE